MQYAAVTALVAQRIEHLTTDQKVVGSTPTGCANKIKGFRKLPPAKNPRVVTKVVTCRFFLNGWFGRIEGPPANSSAGRLAQSQIAA